MRRVLFSMVVTGTVVLKQLAEWFGLQAEGVSVRPLLPLVIGGHLQHPRLFLEQCQMARIFFQL